MVRPRRPTKSCRVWGGSASSTSSRSLTAPTGSSSNTTAAFTARSGKRRRLVQERQFEVAAVLEHRQKPPLDLTPKRLLLPVLSVGPHRDPTDSAEAPASEGLRLAFMAEEYRSQRR